MKFLCVRCDEGMKLERVEEPEEDGSLSVVFACTACGNQVAMLTNPWETQLVRALDVRIGERPSPAEPMEFVRRMLASAREAGLDAASSRAPASGITSRSGCPFSAVVNLAAERPGMHGESGYRGVGGPGKRGTGEPESNEEGSGVPDRQIAWSPDAERRLERIPEFIRPMVRLGIEKLAVERGYECITEAVMEEARSALGM